ncbi:MAG: Uma2 family endonuclease [Campylobacterales bacterium]|nr:Uma2 family endonuclease [Campylobacterales bacterium]
MKANKKFDYYDYAKKEGRWELIDGEFYNMSPAPTNKHQWMCTRLWAELDSKLINCCECKPFVSPIDWVIDMYNTVQPDVAIFCDKSEFFANNFKSTPIFIAEIVSKSSVFKDKNIKYRLYEKSKVKYYLIVEPEYESADLFELIDDRYQFVKSIFHEDRYEFDILNQKIEIDFNSILQKIEEPQIDPNMNYI